MMKREVEGRMNTQIKNLICISIVLILCVGISFVVTDPLVIMVLGFSVGVIMKMIFLVWSDK